MRPSRQVALTSKLTDANNAEQPQLMFQQKAVEAFHSCHAEEAEAALQVANPSIQTIPAPSSDNMTPTMPPPRHKLSTVTNKDTDSNQHDEDENGDDQPKPHKSLIFTSQIVN